MHDINLRAVYKRTVYTKREPRENLSLCKCVEKCSVPFRLFVSKVRSLKKSRKRKYLFGNLLLCVLNSSTQSERRDDKVINLPCSLNKKTCELESNVRIEFVVGNKSKVA